MTFAEKIKELRKQKRLSQEQASQKIGIAISSLRNYENGRLPDTYQMKLIKNFYNVSYEYLVDDSNVKILEDFYNELKNCKVKRKENIGYADKIIKHHYTLVSEILNSAIKWGYLYNNPNKNVTPIKVHRKEVECYSPEDVEKLIKVLQKEPSKYQAIILLALDSGCRRYAPR